MNNHDILDDEPPPSYEEATGRPSHTHRPPPPTPPRPTNTKINTNPFTPSTPGGPASPAAAGTPHTPAQTFQQILPAASQTVRQQFPPAFNLYRDAFPGAQRSYFLGEHQATPLYSVTAGWAASASGASLILHNGPSDDHAPLGTAAYGAAGRRMAVSLPPLPGRAPQPPHSVHTPTVMDPTFNFVVEIPSPPTASASGSPPPPTSYHSEKFEWRRSSSGAVGGLGGRAHGWKLVRLSNELPPGGMAVAGSGPPSGDGHEVVAVCTESVMSVSKLWKFSFLGTGLSRALGEQWAVMAVVTGLVIWDHDRRRD
ncbi:hypothetical protein INS49_000250 [Diaporthe citri]|uniref:uncharacterized protein n=1 Tax=Diaporthe citri TaxID=83186 RepID=UPI001C819FBC|nr:uncharacterized protein INS49_000250 [Diaporthe citri]KAG6366074.1 hypothetical protein INS49_000250 [Diaporthe citri]